MKNIITFLILLFSFEMFAQGVQNEVINADQNNSVPYFQMSVPKKNVHGRKRKPVAPYEIVGHYNSYPKDTILRYLGLEGVGGGGFFTSSTAEEATEQDGGGFDYDITNVGQLSINGTGVEITSDGEVELGATTTLHFHSLDSMYHFDAIPKIDTGQSIYLMGYGADGISASVDINSIGQSYGVYTAIFENNFSDPPIVTVLENTLGEVLNWGYVSPGIWTVSSTGLFEQDDTILFINQMTSNAGYQLRFGRDNDTQLHIFQTQITTDGVDIINVLSDANITASIEIRVYND